MTDKVEGKDICEKGAIGTMKGWVGLCEKSSNAAVQAMRPKENGSEGLPPAPIIEEKRESVIDRLRAQGKKGAGHFNIHADKLLQEI